jgi:hypothetical protein
VWWSEFLKRRRCSLLTRVIFLYVFHRLPWERTPKKFIYIFIYCFYLKIFSVSPVMLLQMIGRLVNNDLEIMWKEAMAKQFIYYQLGRTGKLTNMSLVQDVNLVHPEYEVEKQSTLPWRSVFNTELYWELISLSNLYCTYILEKIMLLCWWKLSTLADHWVLWQVNKSPC